MHNTHIIRICDRNTNLLNHFPRIDFMTQEESCDTCFRITINYRPVNRSGSPVLRQKRSMKIEGSQTWHIPYHFGQHTKSNYYLQIGLPLTQSLNKNLIFQLFRLQQRKTMFQRILFHWRKLKFMSPPCRFIRHGDDTYYIISTFY